MAQANIVNVKKALDVKKLVKMLHHFQAYNFIKLVSNKAIQFSFISENLKEFIRREWFLANLVYSDQPAFLFNSLKESKNLHDAFKSIKNLTDSVPFSLIEVENAAPTEIKVLLEPTDVVQLFKNHFKIQSGTILRNHTFCAPESAEEFFYKVQKNRKIWWRKFAASPGRFINSTSSTQETDKSVVSEIQAEFPWGLETVETIKYSPVLSDEKDLFEVKVSKRKKCISQVVTCETILENMTFAYLCDSYENLTGEDEREFLRFDRKLAPFKVAVAGTGKSSEVIKSLEELSLLLAKQIRKLGLSVLFLPDACTTSIEKQILRNDSLGVPFTILLNDNTLKDGMIAVRSRDTTLEEHSHVSVVVDYLEKILK